MTDLAVPQNLESLPHVLVIDDDDRIRDLVSRYLNEHGFLAVSAENAATARDLLQRLIFDALVVDVMMPGETGLELVQDLKKTTDLPMILLTALGEVEDRITGFEVGADDYLPKPFEPRELVLRLQALIRRRPKNGIGSHHYQIGPWTFDPEHSELTAASRENIILTEGETTLLKALLTQPGEILSRDVLAELCHLDAGERTIDVQVTRLRRKLEDDSKVPRYLQTVRGKGYLLRAEIL